MSNSEPTIRVNVDLTNPGQFFACCGVLELAGRIDPHSTARFENSQFLVNGDVRCLLEAFFKCRVTVDTSVTSTNEETGDDEDDPAYDDKEVDSHRGRIYPMTLHEPFNLRLDWWTDEGAQRQKLKTWTAGQRVTDLFLRYHKKQKRKGKTELVPIQSMREHFADAAKRYPQDWLREPLPIEVPMAFSYDSRLSRNNALDQGHVGNSTMAFSPAVDVLTLVGLQRFRPRMLEIWTRNLYCTWSQPLTVEIAAVTTLGLIPQLIDSCFEFPIKPRDAQGRYKLFGHAQPVRSSHV
jgi:CRISPR-associated protein Csb3